MVGVYMEALGKALPAEYRSQLDALSEDARTTLEIAVSFSTGGPCPIEASNEVRKQWSASQPAFLGTLEKLHVAKPSSKRVREEDGSPEETSPKKPKSDDDDIPLFTLHSVSVTSPVRKKVNITVRKSTIHFTNPTSGALESSVFISALKRAFLIPTRGKTKPHWTVIISSSDVPFTTTGKASSSGSKDDQPQVVFGSDATPPNVTITDHTSGSSDPTTHPKGTPIVDHLRTFLSHLPFPTLEPSEGVFRSALSSSSAHGGIVAGVDGFRGAKSGTLWFFDQGVLWDARPSEFWALSDLVGGSRKGKERAVDVDLGGAEGVRTISATGRSCSVILRRKLPPRDAAEEDEEEEVVGEEGIDTDIGMVDGKEQEVIARWVKKYRPLFGIEQTTENGTKQPHPNEDDDSDEDDSDFVGDSESDGGSATSDSSESDGEGGGRDDDGSGGEEDHSAVESGDEMEVDSLDPKRHPLMRPGAVPRMSKAAIEAAVGMVQEAFVGPSGGDEEDEIDDEEDDHEEDELED
ncbi:hypothetical protein NLI96_g8813 [Meripilus lineatus]|uniref:Histone chaperone RTT106/FACT complex subunit SPT16-like middle domain-containing protein n=1 Tax=Meripilus lineatus TaxID=2056292 RepID=A0AAD5UWZ3_9APHY|nr:hypothetical protein NLI96_g8813 [Physisporinus lineatus]